MAKNKESGTTSAPQIPNPYGGFQTREGFGTSAINPFASSPKHEIPDPTKYLFGTSSSGYQADLNKYNHQMQSAQWDAQLALMADERRYAEEMYNKYNSPEAQARQMREAGLNPDLQGVQSQGFSSPQSAGPSGGVPGMSTGGDKPLTLMFLQALPQAIQMATSIQGSIFNLQNQRLSIDDKMFKLAYDDILSSVTPEMFDSEGKFIGIRNTEEFNTVRDRALHLRNNFSKRFLRSYNNSIERIFTSNMASVFSDFNSYRDSGLRSRRSLLDMLASYGFDLPEDSAIQVLKEFNEIVFKGRKKNAENDYLSAQNDAIPSLLAKANAKLDSSDRGDNFVGAIMYFLAIILQGNMSINRGTDGNYSGSFGF